MVVHNAIGMGLVFLACLIIALYAFSSTKKRCEKGHASTSIVDD